MNGLVPEVHVSGDVSRAWTSSVLRLRRPLFEAIQFSLDEGISQRGIRQFVASLVEVDRVVRQGKHDSICHVIVCASVPQDVDRNPAQPRNEEQIVDVPDPEVTTPQQCVDVLVSHVDVASCLGDANSSSKARVAGSMEDVERVRRKGPNEDFVLNRVG